MPTITVSKVCVECTVAQTQSQVHVFNYDNQRPSPPLLTASIGLSSFWVVWVSFKYTLFGKTPQGHSQSLLIAHVVCFCIMSSEFASSQHWLRMSLGFGWCEVVGVLHYQQDRCVCVHCSSRINMCTCSCVFYPVTNCYLFLCYWCTRSSYCTCWEQSMCEIRHGWSWKKKHAIYF